MSVSWADTYAEQRPKAVELYEQAKRVIAAGSGTTSATTRSRRCTSSMPEAPKWDVDGNEYIDYGMGNGALLLGHSHRRRSRRSRRPSRRGSISGTTTRGWSSGAGLIHELIPCAEQVRFDNSGTEGTMLALRLARAYTGRTKVLLPEGHFQGWHDYVGKGAYPPFDKAVSLGHPESTLDTILVIPADLDQVERTLRGDRDIAAVMLEPSAPPGGPYRSQRSSTASCARKPTTRYEVPLIYDEVINGRYGGYQGLIGVTPDLAVLGKIVAPAACRWRGRRAHRDHEAIRLRRPPARPLRPCLAPWDVQRQPLSTASGIASLRLVADGSPGAQARPGWPTCSAAAWRRSSKGSAQPATSMATPRSSTSISRPTPVPARRAGRAPTTDAATLKGSRPGRPAFQRNEYPRRRPDVVHWRPDLRRPYREDVDRAARLSGDDPDPLDERIIGRVG